jgi:hypothetical protein
MVGIGEATRRADNATGGFRTVCRPPRVVRVTWKPGDLVIHASCPEWGVGVVRQAGPGEHGEQRLRVRFERAGLRTLSTRFARLRPATEPSSADADTFPARSAPDVIDNQMMRLPEGATDPFASLATRMQATLDLYRYTPEGASLLEWASAQTGLRDPLSKYTRHELEAHFDRFRHVLDGHAQKLAGEMSRQSPADLAKLIAAAAPDAARALRQFHPRR